MSSFDTYTPTFEEYETHGDAWKHNEDIWNNEQLHLASNTSYSNEEGIENNGFTPAGDLLWDADEDAQWVSDNFDINGEFMGADKMTSAELDVELGADPPTESIA